MATVTMTSYFNALDGWPGNLLDAYDGATINTKTATAFAFTYPPSHQFAGYKVTVTGTGFAYSGDTPTAGTMSKIVITDDSGHTVLTVAGLAANTPASDLSLFAANVFGWDTPGGGQGSQQLNTWSMLLSGNAVVRQ